MALILNWVLRGVYIALGFGAGLWLLRWLVRSWRAAPEKWPLRIALGMLFLAAIYGAGHARLLANRQKIEAAREEYAKFGDPRRTEARRAEVRGWILDCSGQDSSALADYRAVNGHVSRDYPLGQAGANLIGGGTDTIARDFTVERLFAHHLREPRSLLEAGQLHPAGTDLQLTLCREPTAAAYRLLKQAGRPGAVVMEDVNTGAIIAYAATGGPLDAPYGIKRYEAPGSVFKLALTALWYEHHLPDDIPIPCPSRIQVTPRASVSNYHDESLGIVNGPVGMLVPSCNTAAIWMALYMRDKLGAQAFVDAYRRFGFETYADKPPADTTHDFWDTDNPEWADRMTPPPSRIRISPKTGRAEWAQIAIGQGPVDVTVVGISRFIQAIGNGGVMVRPTIEAKEAKDSDEGWRVMSERTAQKLLYAMGQVVQHGTAATAGQLLRGTDWSMAGKTGTPEFPHEADSGWFAGLAIDPQGHPRYTVVVFLRQGGPGGAKPATLAAQMVKVIAEGGAERVTLPTVTGGGD